jgi:cell division septum initiation protein DivIVA
LKKVIHEQNENFVKEIKSIKREIPEMKNTIAKLKKVTQSFNSQVIQFEESGTEERAFEITESGEAKEKEVETMKKV